jgi:hypothetical protein
VTSAWTSSNPSRATRSAFAVLSPGEQHQPRHPERAQVGEDPIDARPERVLDRERAGEPVVDGGVHERVAGGAEPLRQRVVHPDSLPREERAAAHDEPAVPQRGLDAVRHHVAHVAVELRAVEQPPPPRLLLDRGGERVREVLLHARGVAQERGLVDPVEDVDRDHARPREPIGAALGAGLSRPRRRG